MDGRLYIYIATYLLMVQDSAAPYGAANLYRDSLGLSGSVWGLRSSGSKYRGQKLKNFKNKYTLETFKNKKTTATTTTKVRLRRPSGGSCRRGKEFRIQSEFNLRVRAAACLPP